MGRERPIVERQRPDNTQPTVLRAIISPCTGCKNNVEPPVNPEEMESQKHRKDVWPCPKRVLYAKRKRAQEVGDRTLDYGNPVYNESLLGVNPVWPGQVANGENLGNKYGYVFIATFEDNVDNGWNPEFDTARIRCRGPFLIAQPERVWNFHGRAAQWDTVLGWTRRYYVDGAEFHGFILEAATWQVAKGYSRKVDNNLGRTLSGKSRF